jgi:anti-sigma B factor antagonist
MDEQGSGGWSFGGPSRLSHAEPLRLAERQVGETVVVAVRGDLDDRAAPLLRGHALRVLARPIGALALDLGGVSFLDSSGLSALIAIWREADARRVEFALAAVPDQARRVMTITETSALFRIVEDPETMRPIRDGRD